MHLKQLLSLALVLTACGVEPATEPTTPLRTQTSALLGGLPASSHALDAVGVIAIEDESGALFPVCTGTLIGPSSVLTAKHCAVSAWDHSVRHMDFQPVYFAIGPDVSRPLERIQMADVAISPVTEGGLWKFEQGFGNDVAVYTLATEATAAQPLPIMPRSLGAADLEETFQSIGYGLSYTPNRANLAYGIRRIGAARVRATDGLFFEHLFGTLEAFLEHQRSRFPEELWPHVEHFIVQHYFENDLLPEYDAWVTYDGAVANQPCFGDSGGPLLHSRGGQGRNDFEVAGVVSGGESGYPDAPCAYGTWYGTFGPRTRAFIDQTLTAAQR